MTPTGASNPQSHEYAKGPITVPSATLIWPVSGSMLKNGASTSKRLQLSGSPSMSAAVTGGPTGDRVGAGNPVAADQAACRYSLRSPRIVSILRLRGARVAGSEGRPGKLLIGVDDDGNVIGFDPDLQTLRRQGNKNGYELFLRQRLDDSLSVPTAEIVGISFESIEGKDVCVESASSSSKPVFAKPHEGGSGYSEFWVRIENATKQLHGDDMLDYQANHWG